MLSSSNLFQSTVKQPAVNSINSIAKAAQPGKAGGSKRLEFIISAAMLMSKEELAEAQEIAVSLKQDLEQVLLNSAFLSPALLGLCREAIAYIDQEKLSEGLAVSALNMAWRKQISFREGLMYFGWGW